ncbi:hypothetical protein FOVSG1_010400 [Fusarium oxysporum f. sp. vasinfectum]
MVSTANVPGRQPSDLIIFGSLGLSTHDAGKAPEIRMERLDRSIFWLSSTQRDPSALGIRLSKIETLFASHKLCYLV